MKLTHISVQNYKSLRQIECNLSDFVCVVGENNAGKSSLLQAINLFMSGERLDQSDYYLPGEDIIISVTIGGVTADYLSLLTEEQATKIEGYLEKETLVLTRRYNPDGTSKLQVCTWGPVEAKYSNHSIDAILSGLKRKDISVALLSTYPETTSRQEAEKVTSQENAKEIVRRYVAKLPKEQLKREYAPLPTGFDNSIRSILPKVVYIPAVKDLGDDLKTKDSASFGKLLNILLELIEDDLGAATKTFDELRKNLNRIEADNGVVLDNRIAEVKQIESTIQRNLQETFQNVSIELSIPPPEIKTVLSGATIEANDGVMGPIQNKGDGFKRALAFSILRSYVQLSQEGGWKIKVEKMRKSPKANYLFLFEEPELYLHPRAQNILFEALSLIAKSQQVIVTTHSPYFFSPTGTTTFMKMIKGRFGENSNPESKCFTIDLTSVSEKDKFQLISFESSNQAFFSDRIVLVEGDSELIVLPHLAKLLNDSWDFKSTSIGLIKVSGKGSIQRYVDYFKRFKVEVFIVADLDTLVEGFDKLEASERATKLRSELLQEVDKIIEEENKGRTPDVKMLVTELKRVRANELYNRLIEARQKEKYDEVISLLGELFQFEWKNPRLEVLMNSRITIKKKRELLEELRKNNVYIFEKGAIEDYYPPGIMGADKPSRAQSFCKLLNSKKTIAGLCDQIKVGKKKIPELQVILNGIFEFQKSSNRKTAVNRTTKVKTLED